MGRDGLPTVFHGFARFGRAVGEGLTVVAPLAPIAPLELGRFWRAFYRSFADVLDVESALATATPCPLVVPVVLFLRHRFGRQFTRHAVNPDDFSFEPGADEGLSSSAQLSAELSISGKLLVEAEALQKRYGELGLVFPGSEQIDKARARQGRSHRISTTSSLEGRGDERGCPARGGASALDCGSAALGREGSRSWARSHAS